VNFNGTGTVAIRASGNVSSITDNGVGIYTVNFTTALQDDNYNTVFGGGGGTANVDTFVQERYSTPTRTVSALAIYVSTLGGSLADREIVSVSIFR
jgi:sensor histidine kinase YesM